MYKRTALKVALTCAFALSLLSPAQAQDNFPSAPIQLIAPFAAGGGFDAVGRAVSEQLTKILGTSVIVVNKPGAGGMLGGVFVANAKPDGYTLLLAGPGTLAIGPNLYNNKSFEPVSGLLPISFIGGAAYFLVARPDFAPDLKTFIAKAKASPGVLNYSSPGIGSNLHLTMELLKISTGTDIVHVPYPGTGPAILEVVSGRIQATLAPEVVLPNIRAGQLVGLAVTTATRSPLMPNIPTLAEAGLPGLESSGWYGMLAPAGTPPRIIEKLNAAVNQMLASDAFKQQAKTLGLDLVGGAPDALARKIDEESKRWKNVIKVSNIKAQ